MVKPNERFERRERRVRYALTDNGGGRPRLSVFRSGRHIYGQVIDDAAGPHRWPRPRRSTRGCAAELKTGADREAARRVGLLLAERARPPGVEQVMFDRGGYRYHGRVKALADGAREGGLAF